MLSVRPYLIRMKNRKQARSQEINSKEPLKDSTTLLRQVRPCCMRATQSVCSKEEEHGCLLLWLIDRHFQKPRLSLCCHPPIAQLRLSLGYGDQATKKEWCVLLASMSSTRLSSQAPKLLKFVLRQFRRGCANIVVVRTLTHGSSLRMDRNAAVAELTRLVDLRRAGSVEQVPITAASLVILAVLIADQKRNFVEEFGRDQRQDC